MIVTITSQAAERIKELIAEEGATYLRVFVQGGGCSGFQYGLLIEKDKGEADQVFESNNVKIIIDPVSSSYLKGAEIDFMDNGSGGGFSVKNPNAISTCGCGQSFNTE